MRLPKNKIFESLADLINEKLEKNKNGGRPNFLQALGKERDSVSEVLNVLELAWLKDKSFRRIAEKYSTSYHTIYRLIRKLEPFKEPLTNYLREFPNRKVFYHKDLNTSDYETVRAYIRRAKRDGLRHLKDVLKCAAKAWRALGYKDPASWTPDEVVEYLSTLTYGAASGALDAIRQVAPAIKEEVRTGRYREKLRRRKKDIFAKEFTMIIEALQANDMAWEETVLKLHVTLGAREGKSNPKSGVCGVSWDRFHKRFAKCDLWESKVRGGLWSRDCPVSLFFSDLPKKLRQLWIERGRPATEKVILGGYSELTKIYKQICAVCLGYWKGKTEPDVLKEMTTLLPHDADRIHVNLLWEAEVPLEVVAGQDLGRGEALGLMGRVWLDVNTIKRYYLSLTQRSDRFKRLEALVKEYSQQFNMRELWYVS